MVIEWSNPPSARHRAGVRGRWVAVLAPLMERPGEWALVKKGTYSSAQTAGSQLRHRKIDRPDGRWEFAARTLGEESGLAGLWARYLGPDDA